MSNLDYLLKNGIIYLLDEYENAVFKFTSTGKGNLCEVKFKGKIPYKIDCSTNLAMQAILGGTIITKEQYEEF
ncbi:MULTISPECIES: hypothetical protein [Riemerella]|uniref:Uncharacterized protein n=1 Tax=Riemerella columbipharyngis TaxID=1071918 RepID=A0A1G7ALK4_9FLAO|nr:MULTISPECIES: hypothetical protein [Riemerella]SDE15729.1 hypothetical protein SAMN05421544_10424 [Riemerella columbipharyngis]